VILNNAHLILLPKTEWFCILMTKCNSWYSECFLFNLIAKIEEQTLTTLFQMQFHEHLIYKNKTCLQWAQRPSEHMCVESQCNKFFINSLLTRK
jgi:hypothetical protein